MAIAVYNASRLNYVWLAWALIHTSVAAFIDLLEYWPQGLYIPPSSPLHIFHNLKTAYIAEFNDPIAQWSPKTASGHDSWMGFFAYWEMLFLLPVLLFTIYRLGIKRVGTSGQHELLLMLYSFETAFTTGVCIFDVFFWDRSVYTQEIRDKLVWQMYLPWVITPTLIFFNMASRILARIRIADTAVAAKKVV